MRNWRNPWDVMPKSWVALRALPNEGSGGDAGIVGSSGPYAALVLTATSKPRDSMRRWSRFASRAGSFLRSK